MPTKLSTGRVEFGKVDGVISGLKVIATPEFVERSMNLQETGERVLSYLKKIFPKSPVTYPERGRVSLVSGWAKRPHPPQWFGNDAKRLGFTVTRNTDSERDHEIIASLDQGSKAYTRLIPKGKRTAFLQTGFNLLRKDVPIGDPVFVTGNGLLFRYKGRRGLHFMDRTYNYATGLMAEARRNYRNAARRKVRAGAK